MPNHHARGKHTIQQKKEIQRDFFSGAVSKVYATRLAAHGATNRATRIPQPDQVIQGCKLRRAQRPWIRRLR